MASSQSIPVEMALRLPYGVPTVCMFPDLAGCTHSAYTSRVLIHVVLTPGLSHVFC
jgi:hypothetical protein